MKSLITAFLLLCLTVLPGCFSRYILTVNDGITDNPANRSTVVQTLDVKTVFFVQTIRWVYWECGQSGRDLSCTKICDVRDDEGDKLLCPRATSFGF